MRVECLDHKMEAASRLGEIKNQMKPSTLKGGVKNLDFSAGKENLDANRGLVKHGKPTAIDTFDKFSVSAPPIIKEKPREHDPRRLAQRQKQISYGKNTLGHERYLQLVPKNARTRTDPQTSRLSNYAASAAGTGR